MKYDLNKDPAAKTLIDQLVAEGMSVRKVAEESGVPYGQVRGYLSRRQVPSITPPPDSGPAILLYDIETAPALAWMWGAYNENIIAIEQDWYLLSVAYKWLGQDKIEFTSIFQDVNFVPNTDDDRLVANTIKLLFDAADMTVAHNGDRFDKRKVNARLLYHGIDPPEPYQTFDTAKVSRRYFANYLNSLKDLGRLHDIGAKVEHEGFSLWRKCMAGDPDAWARMEAYNRQDIVVMENLYNLLSPWAGTPGTPGGINQAFFSDEKQICPKCGHDKLTKRGFHRTLVSEFQTYQCKRCRGYSRARKRESQARDGGPGLVG